MAGLIGLLKTTDKKALSLKKRQKYTILILDTNAQTQKYEIEL